MDPWTERIALAWRSSIRFFKHRYDILERLEEEGLLWGFRVEEEEISVRLGDPSHLLTFTPTYATGGVLRPDGDPGRLRLAMELVLESIEPGQLVGSRFDFQWLIAAEGEYDEVRAAAAAAFLAEAPGAVTDLAAWLDGELDDGKPYVLECGVVEADEVPPRLARTTGRFRAARSEDIPPSLWPVEDLPAVAFFCDMNVEPTTDIDSADSYFTLLGDCRIAAEPVISALMSRFEITPANE